MKWKKIELKQNEVNVDGDDRKEDRMATTLVCHWETLKPANTVSIRRQDYNKYTVNIPLVIGINLTLNDVWIKTELQFCSDDSVPYCRDSSFFLKFCTCT